MISADETTAGAGGVPRCRRGRGAALLVLALDLFLTVGYVFFALRNGPTHLDWSILAFAVMPLAGAVILSRQPRNPVGWVLAALGLFNVINNLFGEYAYYALITRPGSLPWGDFFAWASATWWIIGQPLTIAAILLFPDGRPPTRRWWLLLGLVFAICLPLYGYFSALFWNFRGPRLLLPDLPVGLGPADIRKVGVVLAVWEVTFAVGLVLAVIGQGLRFARSRGIERQQLKWILLAMSLVPVDITFNLVGIPPNNPLLAAAGNALNILSIMAFPVAMAFAITRYHLYDIDVIIRRTLLYGALTVCLSLLYFGSVVVFQAIVSRLNGGESPVSVVLSTLLIALLFSPLRGRFQHIIDRRFYRQKYNSQQIMEAYSASLRVEVNLDAINAQLLKAVTEALQPDTCALWLVSRPKGDGR